MRISRLLLTLIVLVGCLLTACKTTMAVRKGDTFFNHGEYHAAAIQYGKAYRRLGGDEKALRAHVAFYRGESYRQLNVPVKAENEYRKAIRYAFPSDSSYLRMAQTLQKNGKYTEAAEYYHSYLNKYPEDELALNGLYACNQISRWASMPPLYAVKKATDLNTRKSNFSPLLMPTDYTTLLFTSSAKVKKDKKPSKITGLPDNDFWMTSRDINGKWEKPAYLEAPINSEFDDGAGAFTSDGKTLYFTRAITKSDSIESASKVEIFKSVRSGTTWSEPEKVQIHRDSTVLFAHPAVSPDDRYLYFVSDLKGGYGGKDIWRSEMSASTLGPPENLGPLINTRGDEVFPVFRNDSSLYFSSDGHPGFGGLDLFMAVYQGDSLLRVDNLRQPINSNGDDFGLTFFGKEDKGYFSTNRKEARGWDQLWTFETAKAHIVVEGTVYDRFGEAIPSATIRIVNDKGTNTKLRTERDGTYRFELEKGAEYVMLGTARSYLNYANRFYSLNRDKDTTYQMDFSLTPLYRPVRIDNIFFEFDKATLLPESMPALVELHKLLLDNPHIVVEISAHTDRIGSDEYNTNLSGMRAQAVVDYLLSQGIDTERLVPKGYGKSQPVKVDERMTDTYRFLKEGTYLDEGYINTLTPEQQEIADQINRRSEFKVLKTTYKLF